jgi:hypothetical protein
VPPESGVYINSLPGVSIEAIDSTANAEQITYLNVWADVQTEAYDRFSLDFFNALMQCYTVRPYCDYENLICINKKVLLTAWKYALGAQIMLFRLYSSRLNYFTTVTRDEAKEQLNYYSAEYEAALSKAIKLVNVKSCCLPEGGDYSEVIQLP